MGFSQLFSKAFSLWECEWVKVRSCGSRGLVQVRAQVCGRICTADEWSSSSVLSGWEGPGGTLRLRYLDVTGQVQLTGPHPLPRLSLSVRVSKPGGALAFPCWWPQRLGSLALGRRPGILRHMPRQAPRFLCVSLLITSFQMLHRPLGRFCAAASEQARLELVFGADFMGVSQS